MASSHGESKADGPPTSSKKTSKKDKSPGTKRDVMARRGQLNQDNFVDAVVAARKKNESKLLPEFVPNSSHGKTPHEAHPFRVLLPAPDFRYLMGEIDGSKFEYCGRPEIEVAVIDLREIYHQTHAAMSTRYREDYLHPFFVKSEPVDLVPRHLAHDPAGALQAILSSPTAVKIIYEPLKQAFYLSEEVLDELIELYQLAMDRNESPMVTLENYEEAAGMLASPNQTRPSVLPASASAAMQRRRSAMMTPKPTDHGDGAQMRPTGAPAIAAPKASPGPTRGKSASAGGAKAQQATNVSPQRARPSSSSAKRSPAGTPTQGNRSRANSGQEKRSPHVTSAGGDIATGENGDAASRTTLHTSDSDSNASPARNRPRAGSSGKPSSLNSSSAAKRGAKRDRADKDPASDIGKITIPRCLQPPSAPSSPGASPPTSPKPLTRPTLVAQSHGGARSGSRSNSRSARPSSSNLAAGGPIHSGGNSGGSSRRASAAVKRPSGSAQSPSRPSSGKPAAQKTTPPRPVQQGQLTTADPELSLILEDFAEALSVFDPTSNKPQPETDESHLRTQPVAVDVHQTISEWRPVLVTTFCQFGKPGPETWQLMFTMNAERRRLWERFVRLHLRPVLEDYDAYVAWQARRTAFYEAQQLLMGGALEDFDFDMLSANSGSLGGGSQGSAPHFIFPHKDPRHYELQRLRLERLRQKKEAEAKAAAERSERLARLAAKRRAKTAGKDGGSDVEASGKSGTTKRGSMYNKTAGQQIADGMTMMQRMKLKKAADGAAPKKKIRAKRKEDATTTADEDSEGA